MIGPRGLGKGDEFVASSCFEGCVPVRAPCARRLPINRRAHSRRTEHAHASCVPRYSCYICRCRASFSATSFAARVHARRACVCRQGFGGAGRGRLLALPCPSPVSATAHLIRRSAGLRQHLHLHQRVRPVPPAWHARFLPPASAAPLRVRRPPAPRGPGACRPGRTGTALFGCVKSARACWPQFCWALRSGSESCSCCRCYCCLRVRPALSDAALT
jgi:hypothetical protein